MRSLDVLRRGSWLALLAALSLLFAACADGDGDPDGGVEPTAAGSPADADDPTDDTGDPTDGDPADGDAADGDAATEAADPLAPQPLAEETPVRVASNILLPFMAPVIVADAFGEFEKENLVVEGVEVVPATEGYTLTARGELDVMYGAPDAALLNAVNSGLELKWVTGNFVNPPDSKFGLWARTDVFDDPENPDYDQLEGATRGSPAGPGGIATFAVAAILQDLGVDFTTLETQQLSPGDVLVALENGSIETGWLLDPFWEQADDNPDLIHLGGAQDIQPLGGAFFGPTLLTDNPEVGQAYVRAVQRTIDTYLQGDWMQDEEVAAAVAEATDQSVDAVTDSPPLIFTLEIGDGFTDAAQEIFLAEGVLDFEEPMPESDLVDRSYVDAVTGG